MDRELVGAEERCEISNAGDTSGRGNCDYVGYGEFGSRDISGVAGVSTMAASARINDIQYITQVTTKAILKVNSGYNL